MLVRRTIIIFIAVLIIGYSCGQYVQASGLTPGSVDDPVVTVRYVQNYLNTTLKPLEEKLVSANTAVVNLTAKTMQIQKALDSKITLIIGKKTAKIGSKTVNLASPPVVYKGKTILPLRFIGEALHAQVIWNKKDKSITYIAGTNKIILYVNKNIAKVNGKAIKLDVPPIMQNASALVPVRFIGENLQAQVQYIPSTKSIIIKGR